ncbi:uncharacterized protein LOC108735197 [Agrilus planipennis]|uniref:Cytidine deaminase n=1 Tax=Agrilus planipennis TaxID=224129 RepID=A0A1W4WR91_AGRPL|nr:uncharacterized protein LOC108735197 [Agrilus planipennis]
MQSLKVVEFDKLDTTIQELLREATKAREFAYCPYSNFSVGACLQCEDGTLYRGCNVENAAYPAGICAERTAFVKAISEGKSKFKSLAVIANQEKFITPPCGICRQFMSEFDDITVYLAKPTLESATVLKLSELLPFQFQLNSDFTF